MAELVDGSATPSHSNKILDDDVPRKGCPIASDQVIPNTAAMPHMTISQE